MSKRAKRGFQVASAWVIALALSAALLYGLAWVLWQSMLKVPPDLARLWALVATGLLPVTAWVTYALAMRVVYGRLQGIDDGISKVSKAGAVAASLRVHVHHALRRPEPVTPTVILPDLEIVQRRLGDGSGDVVEL